MKKKRVIAFLLACMVVLNTIPCQQANAAKKTALSQKKITLTVGQQKKLELKNEKKKIKWSIVSGKKNISLKKKTKTSVMVKAVKKGTAKVGQFLFCVFISLAFYGATRRFYGFKTVRIMVTLVS